MQPQLPPPCLHLGMRLWVMLQMVLVLGPVMVMMGDAQTVASVPPVIGAGSRSPSTLMKQLAAAYMFANPGVTISYTSLTAPEGQCRILDYATQCAPGDVAQPTIIDFALSETSLPPSLTNEFLDVEALPMFATGMVPTYNLPTLPPNATLVLSTDILGRIYRQCHPSPTCPPGSIFFWNDTDIVALNPHLEEALTLAGAVIPVVRLDAAGQTLVMKSGIAASIQNATSLAAFTSQVPIDTTSDWGPSLAIKINLDTNPYVMNTPSTIGYTSLPSAMRDNLTFASLYLDNGLTVPLTASTTAMDAAVAELGSLPFVLGDIYLPTPDSSLATERVNISTPLWGGKGLTSWPLTGYTYLMYHQINVRAGGNCASRLVMMNFFQWYYQSAEAQAIVRNLGFSTLGENIIAFTVNHFVNEFRCETADAYVAFIEQESGTEVRDSILYYHSELFMGAFDNIVETTTNVFNDGKSTGYLIDVQASTNPLGDLLASSVLGSVAIIPAVDIDQMITNAGENPAGFVSLPFAAIAGGVAYNLCPVLGTCAAKSVKLQLSVDVIIDILNGDITMWNDAKIAALNSGSASLLPNAAIAVFKTVSGWETLFATALANATGNTKEVTYRAANPSVDVLNDKQATSLVSGLEYSFVFFPVLDPSYTVAAIAMTDESGDYMLPTISAIENCTYNAINALTTPPRYKFNSPYLSNCYPIVVPVYLTIRMNFTEDECEHSAGNTAALFLKFFFALFDTDFFIGAEVYSNVTGQNLFVNTINATSEYEELVVIRDVRETIANLLADWNMGSLIAPFVSNGTSSLRSSYMVELEKANCDGTSIVMEHQDLQGISNSLKNGAIAACVICWLIILAIAGWVIHYREARIIRNNAPLFLLQVLLGAFMGITAIPFLPIDDTKDFDFHLVNGVPPAITEQLSVICDTSIWMIGLGYAIMVSALYIKMWRIVKIFINPHLRKYSLRDTNLFRLELVPISIFAIELLLAQLYSPQKFVRYPTRYSPADGSILQSIGVCETDSPAVAYAPLFTTVLISLIYGNYVSYSSSGIPGQFSEGKWIGVSLALMLISFVFGFPLILLSNSNPTVLYFAKVIMVVMVFGVAPCFLFIPKFLLAYGWIKSDGNALKISNSSSQDKIGSKPKSEQGVRIRSSKEKEVSATEIPQAPGSIVFINKDPGHDTERSLGTVQDISQNGSTTRNSSPAGSFHGAQIVQMAFMNEGRPVAASFDINGQELKDGNGVPINQDRLKVAPWLSTPPKTNGTSS